MSLELTGFHFDYTTEQAAKVCFPAFLAAYLGYIITVTGICTMQADLLLSFSSIILSEVSPCIQLFGH